MKNDEGFYQSIRDEFNAYVRHLAQVYPVEETLTIDMHCHDRNSDVPDELMGRIHNIPETWLSTNDLANALTLNGCDTIALTNHNNTMSCYELRDMGIWLPHGYVRGPGRQTSLRARPAGKAEDSFKIENSAEYDQAWIQGSVRCYG